MEEDTKKNILSRLRRIEGQVKGIQRMIEDENECAEILNQVSAVRSAMSQVGLQMVKCYTRECITQARDTDTFEEALIDSVSMITRLLK